MRPSLRELFEALARSQAACQDHASLAQYQAAQLDAKLILSAGSKLHARLGSLIQDLDDAKFVSEAADAAADARQKYPLPLVGDQPLPFPTADEKPPTPRRRRKGAEG